MTTASCPREGPRPTGCAASAAKSRRRARRPHLGARARVDERTSPPRHHGAAREPARSARQRAAVAAVGAAKDLAEAACKVMVDRAGEKPASSLPALFKQALDIGGRDDAAGDVGRSLAGTVQRLAELRNAAGSGHGRAEQPTVTARDARLAGTAACGIALAVRPRPTALTRRPVIDVFPHRFRTPLRDLSDRASVPVRTRAGPRHRQAPRLPHLQNRYRSGLRGQAVRDHSHARPACSVWAGGSGC